MAPNLPASDGIICRLRVFPSAGPAAGPIGRPRSPSPCRVLEGGRAEGVAHFAPGARRPHEPGLVERLEVPDDRLAADRLARRELGRGGGLLLGEPAEEAAPRRVGERREDRTDAPIVRVHATALATARARA